jgi:zinc-ribbon family
VIILFGTRRMRTALGTVMMLCNRCQRPSAHALIKLRTWFTLFFVPVFPVSIRYATVCPMCGVGTKIKKDQAEQLKSVAAQQAAGPVVMTPDGPMTPYPLAASLPPLQSPPAVVAENQRVGAAPAPGWWMAADQKWYPPELHPDAR